jgi:hypothetical protein
MDTLVALPETDTWQNLISIINFKLLLLHWRLRLSNTIDESGYAVHMDKTAKILVFYKQILVSMMVRESARNEDWFYCMQLQHAC